MTVRSAVPPNEAVRWIDNSLRTKEEQETVGESEVSGWSAGAGARRLQGEREGVGSESDKCLGCSARFFVSHNPAKVIKTIN